MRALPKEDAVLGVSMKLGGESREKRIGKKRSVFESLSNEIIGG